MREKQPAAQQAATGTSVGVSVELGHELVKRGVLLRLPAQERSEAKLRQLLASAAVLLEETGYEAFTTTLLAERSGVAIGTVYHFFDNKHAIVATLASCHLATYLNRLRTRLADPALTCWRQAIDAIVGEYIGMHRQIRGFRMLRFGDGIDAYLLDPDQDTTAVLVGNLTELLAERFTPIPPRFTRALMLAVEVVGGLLKLAFRRHPPDGDPALLDQATVLAHRYLTDHHHLPQLTAPATGSETTP